MPGHSMGRISNRIEDPSRMTKGEDSISFVLSTMKSFSRNLVRSKTLYMSFSSVTRNLLFKGVEISPIVEMTGWRDEVGFQAPILHYVMLDLINILHREIEDTMPGTVGQESAST